MRVGHLATRSSCNKWKRIFRGGGGGGVLKRRRQRRRVTKGTELTVPLVEFLMGTLLSVPFGGMFTCLIAPIICASVWLLLLIRFLLRFVRLSDCQCADFWGKVKGGRTRQN